MRVAFLAEVGAINAWYRCLGPLEALARRGHEARQLSEDHEDRGNGEVLRWCDLVHVHRYCDEPTLRILRAAQAAGAAIVWDDDDDVTAVPRDNPAYRRFGGLRGRERLVARHKLFGLADLVTTPSATLATRFEEAGAARVRVVENQVADHFLDARRRAHDGVVIGWVAGLEHRLDADALPIEAALRQLLERHADVSVVSIGLRLRIDDARYRHEEVVSLRGLPAAISGFDVGIAPLADIPFNRARSNVKLKEYAAVGVPWLASPVGPYIGLGEPEGGELVPDDGWHTTLEHAVASARWRRRHGRRAARWGRQQTVGAHSEAWESMLRDTIQGRTARFALNTHSRMGD